MLSAGRFFGRMLVVMAIDTLPIGRLANLVRDIDIRSFVFVVVHEAVPLDALDLEAGVEEEMERSVYKRMGLHLLKEC